MMMDIYLKVFIICAACIAMVVIWQRINQKLKPPVRPIKLPSTETTKKTEVISSIQNNVTSHARSGYTSRTSTGSRVATSRNYDDSSNFYGYSDSSCGDSSSSDCGGGDGGGGGD